MPNVLIAPAPLRRQSGRFREILVNAGLTPIDPPGAPQPDGSDLLPFLARTDALIAGGEPFTPAMFEQAPRIRVIARTGVGYDAIDIAAATAHKVAVTITPGTNQESVAEQTFALMLAVMRNIAINDRIIKVFNGWDRTLVRPVRDATLGLVGLGRIGKAVAVRAQAFRMKVITYDPVVDEAFLNEHGIERVGLDELLERSDVISLHLPLSDATRGLINRDTLARMKAGAILINTSRGGLVVEQDLHDALVSGHLAGAGLDVLVQEPPGPQHPLVNLPNVVISPHVAGIDTRGMADMANLACQCVADLYQGGWPAECVVNGELREGWTWKRS